MLPVTLARVPHHTKEQINEKLRTESEERIASAIAQGPDAVSARLVELRSEWDIDRACELHGGMVALGGCALAAAVDKRFLAIPIAIGASLALGALFGWSPQYAVLRRFGFRTAGEIERERRQLLAHAAEQGGGGKVKDDLTGYEEIVLDDIDIADDSVVP